MAEPSPLSGFKAEHHQKRFLNPTCLAMLFPRCAIKETYNKDPSLSIHGKNISL
jgi:hypothetical protein